MIVDCRNRVLGYGWGYFRRGPVDNPLREAPIALSRPARCPVFHPSRAAVRRSQRALARPCALISPRIAGTRADAPEPSRCLDARRGSSPADDAPLIVGDSMRDTGHLLLKRRAQSGVGTEERRAIDLDQASDHVIPCLSYCSTQLQHQEVGCGGYFDGGNRCLGCHDVCFNGLVLRTASTCRHVSGVSGSIAGYLVLPNPVKLSFRIQHAGCDRRDTPSPCTAKPVRARPRPGLGARRPRAGIHRIDPLINGVPIMKRAPREGPGTSPH